MKRMLTGKALQFAFYGMIGCLLGSILGEGVIPFIKGTGNQNQANQSFMFSPEVQGRLNREAAKTGDIQIALKWDNYNDLDLHCVDPNGERIYFSNKNAQSGGELDVDMNAGGERSLQPVENIYWANGAAPNGGYQIFVNHYANNHSATSDYIIEVGVKGNSSVQQFTGQVTKGQAPKSIYQFNYNGTGLETNSSATATSANALMVGFWTALLAIGLALALIAGQNKYMHRKPLLTTKEILQGGLGGLVFGILAGMIGQFFYLGQEYGAILEALSKTFSWTLLGALIGLSLSFYIPNLALSKGLLGGLIGGFIGGLGFLIGASLFTDVLGRWLGAAIIGFCIGLMIAFIEQLTREAALEITWAPNEVSLISLGTEPISIGGGDDHIFINGLKNKALNIQLKDAKIWCEDTTKNKTIQLKNNSKLNIGNVQIKVMAS